MRPYGLLRGAPAHRWLARLVLAGVVIAAGAATGQTVGTSLPAPAPAATTAASPSAAVPAPVPDSLPAEERADYRNKNRKPKLARLVASHPEWTRVLAYCNTVAEAERFAELLLAEGVPAISFCGKVETNEGYFLQKF